MRASSRPRFWSSPLVAHLVTHAERYCRCETTAAGALSETRQLVSSIQRLTSTLLEDADGTLCTPAEALWIASLLADVVRCWHEREHVNENCDQRTSRELFWATAEKWQSRSHDEALALQELHRDALTARTVPRTILRTPTQGSSAVKRLAGRLEAAERSEIDIERDAVRLCALLVLRVPGDTLAAWCAAADETERVGGRAVLQLFARVILAAADARILGYVLSKTRDSDSEHHLVSARTATTASAATSCTRTHCGCSQGTDASHAPDERVNAPEAGRTLPDEACKGKTFLDADVGDLWPGASGPHVLTEQEIMDEWAQIPSISSANWSDVSTLWRTTLGSPNPLEGVTSSRSAEPAFHPGPAANARHSIALPMIGIASVSADTMQQAWPERQAKHTSLVATSSPSAQSLLADPCTNEPALCLLLLWCPYHAAAYALLCILHSCASVGRASAQTAASADPLYLAFSTSLVLPAFAFVLRNDIVDRTSLRMRFPPSVVGKAIDLIRLTNEPCFASLHRLWQRAGLSAFLAVAARRYSELGEIPLAMRATDAACVLAGKQEDCFGFLVTNRPEQGCSTAEATAQTPEQRPSGGRRGSSLRATQSERRAPSSTRPRRPSWRSRRRLRSSESIECGLQADAAVTLDPSDASESAAGATPLPSEGVCEALTSTTASSETASDTATGDDIQGAMLSRRLATAAVTNTDSASSWSATWLPSSNSNGQVDSSPSSPRGHDPQEQDRNQQQQRQRVQLHTGSPKSAPSSSTTPLAPIRTPRQGPTSDAAYVTGLLCGAVPIRSARHEALETAPVWFELLRAWREFNESDEQGGPSPALVRRTQRLVRRFGIPDRLRRHFWPLFLQVERRRNQAPPNWYRRLLRLATLPHEGGGSLTSRGLRPDPTERLDSRHPVFSASPISRETLEIIDRDVTRTLCNHRLFWRGGAALGLSALRNILRAYACLDPSVGYCQGMSNIAGALYIYAGGSEERCFFMLVQFMQGALNFREFFLPGFARLCRSVEEFAWLLQRDLPRIARSLQAKEIRPMMYADKWYLTALLYNFPFPLVSRIWDSMLLDGHIKVLHRATLTLMKRAGRAGRLAPDLPFEELLMYLQHGFATDKAVIPSVDVFMDDVWRRVSFSRRQLRLVPAQRDQDEATFAQNHVLIRIRGPVLVPFWQRHGRKQRHRQEQQVLDEPLPATKRIDERVTILSARPRRDHGNPRAPPVTDQDDLAPRVEDSRITSLDSFSLDDTAWKRESPMHRSRWRGLRLRSLWHRLRVCTGAPEVHSPPTASSLPETRHRTCSRTAKQIPKRVVCERVGSPQPP